VSAAAGILEGVEKPLPMFECIFGQGIDQAVKVCTVHIASIDPSQHP
jgi:hypothetical protein